MKFKSYAASLIFFSLASVTSQAVLNYETYLESWDPDWQTALEGLPPGPGGTSADSYKDVTLDIAFAAYVFPGLNGIQYDLSDVGTTVDYVHDQGGTVKISFGGNSYAAPFAPNYFISQTSGWPGNISTLAAGVISVVNTYNFDGVDFDIEDIQPSGETPQEFASELITFLQAVRAGLPSKVITITIPAQGWGTYWQLLAEGVAAIPNLVNRINFMEYDIWINPAVNDGYVGQIKADITTYTSPTSQAPAPNYSTGWGLPASLIQLGLMPGSDDNGQLLSIQGAQILSQYAIDEGLSGVMTWDINRDAGTDPSPPTGAGPYAFSEAIREILGAALLTEKFQMHRTLNRRTSTSLVNFERQLPPPHGSP